MMYHGSFANIDECSWYQFLNLLARRMYKLPSVPQNRALRAKSGSSQDRGPAERTSRVQAQPGIHAGQVELVATRQRAEQTQLIT